MAARKLAALLAAVLHLCLCQQATEVLPEFLAPLENHTVVQGRDIFFTCVVNHLQSYKVAWIKSDTRAILAIHTHMVAHNPRLSVTHNGHNTWKLHVSNVQKNDSGTYMCQVNTDPMRSQMGYMEVHIPPDIADDESANDLVTPEGGSVRLKCVATGYPAPTVTWRREDGRNITLREKGQKKSVKTYEGEVLELTGVMRQEMGTYLCIATNNVPPTISKRYSVDVHFAPVVKAVDSLVVAPLNSNVVIQCHVEACPRAMNTWHRESGDKLVSSKKHVMTEQQLCGYSWLMNLTVNMLNRTDLGGYFCSAENAIGKAEAKISLQKMHVEVATTRSPDTKNVDSKPRDHPPKNRKKAGQNKLPSGAIKNGNNELTYGQEGIGTTQVMIGSTAHEGQRTDRPFVMPSLSPPWVSINGACPTQNHFHYTTILLLFFLPSTAVTF